MSPYLLVTSFREAPRTHLTATQPSPTYKLITTLIQLLPPKDPTSIRGPKPTDRNQSITPTKSPPRNQRALHQRPGESHLRAKPGEGTDLAEGEFAERGEWGEVKEDQEAGFQYE